MWSVKVPWFRGETRTCRCDPLFEKTRSVSEAAPVDAVGAAGQGACSVASKVYSAASQAEGRRNLHGRLLAAGWELRDGGGCCDAKDTWPLCARYARRDAVSFGEGVDALKRTKRARPSRRV